MLLSEWREFPSAPCLAGKKKLMTARVSMLLKWRASLISFRACFLPGQAKDLSAPLYITVEQQITNGQNEMSENRMRPGKSRCASSL